MDEVNQVFPDENIGPGVIANAVMVMIGTTVFVLLRYWARWLTNVPFGLEDILIPIAWFATIGLCIVACLMVTIAGVGRHEMYINRHQLMMYYKFLLVNELVQPAAVAFPKVCVVLLYLRVFTYKWERIASKATIGLILAAWFSYTVAPCFECTPFAYYWDQTIPGGRCFNSGLFAKTASVPNILTDLIIAVLPWKTVAQLKISKGRKFGLILIFMTGSVGIIASIVRTIVFQQAYFLVDVTFNIVPVINWTLIEPGLYLMAACGLSFKPLFRLFAQSLHLHHLFTASSTSCMPAQKSHHHGGVSIYADQKGIQMETYKIEEMDVFDERSARDSRMSVKKDEDRATTELSQFLRSNRSSKTSGDHRSSKASVDQPELSHSQAPQ